MDENDSYGPLHFIGLFDQFNIAAQNPNSGNVGRSATGMTSDGRFYSVEVLFEMLLAISTTYGRLAYKLEQEQYNSPLTATFKKLSYVFLDLANNSYLITNGDNVVRFTELANKNMTLLTDFEKASDSIDKKYALINP